MEQVFFRLHCRNVTTVRSISNLRIRRFVEWLCFAIAVTSLGLLLFLHSQINQSAGRCLLDINNSSYSNSLSSSDSAILYIHIKDKKWEHESLISQSIKQGSNSIRLENRFQEYLKTNGMLHIDDSHSASASTDSKQLRAKRGSGQKIAGLAGRLVKNGIASARTNSNTYSCSNNNNNNNNNNIRNTHADEQECVFDDDNNNSNNDNSIDSSEHEPTPVELELFFAQRVYLYSFERGYMTLNPSLRLAHNITRIDVNLNHDSECFGSPLVTWIYANFIGYDTVIMNWSISIFGGKGYLYNTHSKQLYNLNIATEFIASTGSTITSTVSKLNSNVIKGTVNHFIAFKIGIMLTTLFLFFTTTTLVSFTLRETQERMLKFTFLLQHHVSNRLPYANLVFTHVVESLVFVPIMIGTLFFLFEFFSDQLLAFMVLSVVWLSEVYSVISLRTTPSIRYFPRVFFAYFTLFHIYFFSCPFGFSYLALLTTVLFLLHAMMHFWNIFEVPAFESGLITALNPRIGLVIGGIPDDVGEYHYRHRSHDMGLSPMRNHARSANVVTPRNNTNLRSVSDDLHQYGVGRNSSNSVSTGGTRIRTSSYPEPITQNRPRDTSSNVTEPSPIRRSEFNGLYSEHDYQDRSYLVSRQNQNSMLSTSTRSRSAPGMTTTSDAVSQFELSRRIQRHQMQQLLGIRIRLPSTDANDQSQPQSQTSTSTVVNAEASLDITSPSVSPAESSTTASSSSSSSMFFGAMSYVSSMSSAVAQGFSWVDDIKIDASSATSPDNNVSRNRVAEEWGLDRGDEADSLLADASSDTISLHHSKNNSSNIRRKVLPPPLTLHDDNEIGNNDNNNGISIATSNNILLLSSSNMNRSISVNNFGYRKSEFNLFGMQDDCE